MGIEQSMPEGVIGETDDIKGHVLTLQIRVEIPAHICFLRALYMDDDLCFWAHLTYSLCPFLEEIAKASPLRNLFVVLLIVVSVHHIRTILIFASPEHAIANLIANLNEVGRCSSCYQRLQAMFGISIHRIGQHFLWHILPTGRDILLYGICPSVRIMKVKHKSHSCIFDALAESRNISQILHLTLLGTIGVRNHGIYKQTYASAIPLAGVVKIRNEVCNLLPIASDIWCLGSFI